MYSLFFLFVLVFVFVFDCRIKSSFENLVDGDDTHQYVTFPDDDDHEHNLGSCLDLVDASKSVQLPENGKLIDAVKFEEKRTKTESKTKVVADGFSSEQATSNSAEVKRLQAGDIDYKEAKAAAAMRNRLEVGGVKTEENAALIQVIPKKKKQKKFKKSKEKII